LGRSSPPPPDSWQELQDNASEQGSSETDERRARSQSRDWGRFTRNFIVQGTAAEWALCWMGEVRRELMGLAARNTPSVQTVDLIEDATGRSSPFAGAPHLVFFLHDEIIVHAPAALADEVQQIVIEAAHRAGRLLFGNFPVDFLLTSVVVESYADAK
jgi:DNA polymerase-1